MSFRPVLPAAAVFAAAAMLCSPAVAQKAATKVQQSAFGFTYSLPAGWSVRSDESGQTALFAPGAKDELNLLLYVPPQPDAKRAASDPEFLAAEMAKLMPGARMVGAPERVKTPCGPGTVITLSTTSQGQEVTGRAYSVPHAGGLILVARMAVAADFAAREKEMRAVFLSLTPEKETGDAEKSSLALQWRSRLSGKRLTYLTRSGGGAGGGVQARTDIVLSPGGRFTFESESSVVANVDGASGFSGGTKSGAGTWKITGRAGVANLELKAEDGTSKTYVLTRKGEETYLNGTRYYVTSP